MSTPRQSTSDILRTLRGGLLSGICATTTMYFGARLLDLPFPPDAVFRLVVASVPGSLESGVVVLLGGWAKYSVFSLSVALYVSLYCINALLLYGLFANRMRNLTATLLGTILPVAITIALQAKVSGLFFTLSFSNSWISAFALALGINIVCFQIVRICSEFRPDNRASRLLSEGRGSSRRNFLMKAGVSVTLLLGAGSVISVAFATWKRLSASGGAPQHSSTQITNVENVPAIFRDPRISDLVKSEVTGNGVFYRVDILPVDIFPSELPTMAAIPRIDVASWALRIYGKVREPLTITNAALMKYSTIDEYATLECVSNTIDPPGGLIGTAKWTGVRLAEILERAGIMPDAKHVVFHCADGYAVGIPIERAMKPEVLLAYRMNDSLLPDDHGFPLRALVPGIYGMMNAKWVNEIELLDHSYLGYWQEQGWSNDATIKTMSTIHYPRPQVLVPSGVATPIAGVAFAGDRGISKVEVSTDGGNTWVEAVLKAPNSSCSWVLWAYEWTPKGKGEFTLVARAYDGTGNVQDPAVVPPFPAGASGYEFLKVKVL